MKKQNRIFHISIGIFIGILLSGLFLTTRSYIVRRGSKPQETTIVERVTSQLPLETEELSNGKINLNTATLLDLDTLPGIGPSKAAAIIEFREKYGNYQEVSELLYVPGIGESLYNTIKQLVYVD